MMLLPNSKPYYYYSDHSADHTWIVFSGWSLIGKSLISCLNKSNLLVVSAYDPYHLEHAVSDIFSHVKTTSFSVLGFSLGGLWLSRHLDFFSEAKELVFAGVRPRYHLQDITLMKEALEKNRNETLTHFWKQCVIRSMFKEFYLHQDSTLFSLELLQEGLNYLAEFEFIFPEKSSRVRFLQGQLDRVAPINELINASDSYDIEMVKNQGHVFWPELDNLRR
jgi:hypothetical protein